MLETERLGHYRGRWLKECMNECIQSFSHSIIQKLFTISSHNKFLLASILFCISFSFTAAQVYPDREVDSLLRSGINNIINQKYDYAKKDFLILDKKFPEIPLGKIYITAVEIARSYDLAIPFNSKYITNSLKDAKDSAEKLIDKDDSNKWNYYFLALANGYEAYFNALTNDWFYALSAGVTAVNLFEHCMKVDAEFYESHIAVGTYKYWKSKELEFIGWFPFIKDEKEEGINLLEKAVEKSSYNSYLAINSLVWIYIDKGESEKAVKLCQSALLLFPDSRIFRLGLARAYEDINLDKAINEYLIILNSYQNLEKPNRYNEILLKHLIAQQYKKKGEHGLALQLCDEILNINNFSEYEQQRLKNRLERVKSLRKELLTVN